MAFQKSTPSYKHFVSALRSISSEIPPLTLTFGPSNYLKIKVEEWFANQAPKGTPVERHSVESIGKSGLDSILFQESIFEPSSFHIVRNFDKKLEIQKSLFEISDTEAVRNKILFVSASKSLSKGLQKELGRLKVKIVPCFEPNLYEFPNFLTSLAAKHSLKLDEGAIAALIESIGYDLLKLENEIKKFSLVFATAQKIITADDLAPFLNCLRQEHAFKLDNLLIEGQAAQAQALLHDLLKRGESHLALLGILSNHCRKALQIGQLFRSGQQIKDISQAIGLPFKVVKSYLPYVRVTPTQKFKSALFLCQEADIIFKTSRIDSEIIISEVMAKLARA